MSVTLRKGTIKRIHVHQQVIARCRNTTADEAALTVQTSRGPIRGRRVKINGPAEIVQRLHEPLACGARVWIETRSEVEVWT